MIFIKNITSVSSFNIISQVLPFLFLPYLSEVYSLSSFGELALFTSISIIIGNVISFRFEMSLYNHLNDSKINDIKNLIVLNSLLIIPIILIVVIHFDYSFIYFLISAQVFLVAMTNTDYIIKNIKKEYKKINKANIVRSIMLVSTQIIFSIINNINGLIYGYVISWLFYYLILKENFIIQRVNKTIKIIPKCIDILKHNFTGMIANTLSGNVLTLFIPSVFGLDNLGFYSMAQKIMGAPASLVGMAIGNVYSSTASEEYSKYGNIKNTLKTTLLVLSFLVLIGITTYFMFIENILLLMLSEKWTGLIDYLDALLIYFVMNFIYVSVVGSDVILKKNKYYLFVNLIILLIIIFNLLILDVSLLYFLFINSIVIGFIYLTYLIFLIRKVFYE